MLSFSKHRAELPDSLSSRVRVLGENERVSSAAILLAALEILLLRHVADGAPTVVTFSTGGVAHAVGPELLGGAEVCRDVIQRAAKRLAGAATTAPAADLAFVLDDASTASRNLAGELHVPATVDAETLARFEARCETLLDSMCRAPEATVGLLSILPDAERHRVVVEWNATANAYERDLSIHALVEAQARQTPDAIAVEDEHVRFSYSELIDRASRVAQWLSSRGVRDEARVAITVPRDANMVAALLGILMAGGVYVPIDPKYPAERREYMYRDAGCVLELDTGALAEALASKPLREPVPSHARQLAYIVYTSGSTGLPKGVLAEHRGVVRLLRGITWATFTADDVFVCYAPLGFDASTFEIWAPLLNGGRVVVPPPGVLGVDELAELIRKRGVTVMFLTSGLFHQLVDHAIDALATVRELYTGGDIVSPSHVRRVRREMPHVRMMAAYGPTENTTYSTCYSVDVLPEGEAVSIGRPITNSTVYILDAEGAPTPIGVAGELYTGGDGVARGYVHGAMTAEKFVPDPFSTEPGARLYRTGDIAYWRSDGMLEFIGRRDAQVKLRGFRIELGEIESALAAAGARNAVVVAREDSPGDKRLVAYVVAPAGQSLTAAALRAALVRALPEHMMPSAFVFLDEIPLTANGKVDRKALPAPDFKAAAAEYVAPNDDVEAVLADVFQHVLRVDRVGVNDDFFELGGHSLTANGLSTRLHARLGVRLSIREIFEARTPRALAEAIRARGTTPALATIARVDRARPMAVTSQEARLWFLHRFDPLAPAYNECAALRVRGDLDERALATALSRLEARHEALRTRYVAGDDGPSRVVVEPGSSPPLLRVSAKDDADAAERLRENARQPFDLEGKPPWRPVVVDLPGNEHVVALSIHHIVTDEWSLHVLFRDLGRLYAAERDGTSAGLPEQPFEYADWAAHQSGANADSLDRSVEHFARRLADIEPVELPTDKPRPAQQSFDGHKARSRLSGELRNALSALAKEERTTVSVALLAVLAVLIHRHARATRFAIAMPLAGRPREDLDDVAGFFVNTVAIDFDFSDGPTMRELVRRTREVVLDAQAHGDAPFDRVVSAVQKTRDASRAPLCQVAFAPQPPDAALTTFGGQSAERFSVDVGVSKFDVSVFAVDREDAIDIEVEYATALFEGATMARFVEHLEVLLAAGVRAPGEQVTKLPIMTDAERRLVVTEWNTTPLALGEIRTVHGLVEAQVDRTPDAIAVEFEGVRLTYRELDERANRVAHWVLEHGGVSDDRVTVEVERSQDIVSAVLGVLKAGCAYVPVDPKHPDDRKQFMRDDAGARIVLDEAALAEALGAVARSTRPAVDVRPNHLAYVLFTSGSTGRPKGVMIEHASVVNMLSSLVYEPTINPADATLSLTTLSFDVAVAELFFPLANGARLVIASRETMRDPKLIARAIETTGAHTFAGTPTTWRMMVDSGWRPSRRGLEIHVGGEPLPRDLADALIERGISLWNMYGPTETTVYASIVQIGKGHITVGRPVRNTQFYIVDAHMQPVPIGVAGELCIAGAGVGRGYLGRPELTAEKFVKDPFSSRPDARMYRTGDLTRWLPNGEVDYLGRFDHQVKIRGFRIELGEIEGQLAVVPGVGQAVVVAREDIPGDRRLVAYVVPSTGESVSVDALRAALLRVLPEYMVPSAFIVLAALPRTTTGKVDRKALPAPELPAAASEYVAPRDALEAAVAAIFEDVLRAPRVGVHDDFFELGGHSLLVTQVVSRIRAKFDVELPVRAVFDAPTVARLAAVVKAASASVRVATPIERVDRTQPIRASSAQERLWFLDQLEGGAATYNVPLVLRLGGKLDFGALGRAVDALVERHEALRTTFETVDGALTQIIGPASHVQLARVDAQTDDGARDAVQRAIHAPFDLASGPIFRATLVSVGDSSHQLVLATHHIATDGWSNAILLREIAALYTAFAGGRPSPLPPRAIDYADYAAWQSSRFETATLDPALEFWKSHLSEAPAALELPTDRPRPSMKSFEGKTHFFELGPSILERVQVLCGSERATPFMVLLAAFDVLLARYSGQRDIVVGTPVANRMREELDDVVGFFVNTLAVRTSLAGRPSFREVVQRVREASLAAFEHQELPFERVVQELKPVRDPSRTPIFQAMFAYVVDDDAAVPLGDLELTVEPDALDVSKFDVTLTLEQHAGSLHGSIEYDTALFDPATAERMAEHYRVLLEDALRAPDTRVSALAMSSTDERRRLVVEWNDTSRAFDDTPVYAAFERRAATSPNAVAIVQDGVQLTYGELNRRANQLARVLRKRGIGREDRVATWFPRSADMVLGALAVMKAGAAYVPLDPSHPAARLAFIVADVGARLVLSTPATASGAELGAEVLHVGELLAGEARNESTDDLALPTTHRQAAYVIYTSGTTGQPKGAVLHHRGLANVVAEQARTYALTPVDRVAQIVAPSFDSAMNELWPTLSSGAALYIAPDDVRTSPADLAAWMRKVEITAAEVPTVLAESLFDEAWSGAKLRVLSTGGEALRRRPAPSTPFRLVNQYGPTETTVFVTAEPVEPGSAPVTTIGRPIQNTSIYVLDEAGEPTPVGVFGELCVGGENVGRGYIGRPALTAEKFVPDPFGTVPGARLYRTGDRARFVADGRIEFAGRNDDQVKIRGFRIELGEIESVLASCPGVRESAVLAREDMPGQKRIVAYVVPSETVRFELDAVRAQLRRALPDYMVPALFVTLDAMPLLVSGKLDRKALPAPDRAASATDYVAPRTATEISIAAIWAELLGLARVGANDNFFELGGHSLLAARVVARVLAELGVAVPLRKLFEAPTVCTFAAVVDELRRLAESGARSVVSAGMPPLVRSALAGGAITSFEEEFLLGWERRRKASAVWNHGERIDITGPLDGARLGEAIQMTLARQEALRRTFDRSAPDGRPSLVRPEQVPFERLDARAMTSEAVSAEILRHASMPFAFDNTPLVRFLLVEQGAAKNTLLVSWHQIVHDHDPVSADILTTDIFEHYAALVEDRAPNLPALPIRPVDYAAWVRDYYSTGEGRSELDEMKARLPGAKPVELADRPSDEPIGPNTVQTTFLLSSAESQQFEATCRALSITRFMAALAMTGVVLRRRFGGDDLVAMTLRNFRPSAPELAHLVGRYTGPSAARISCHGNPDWGELMQRAKHAALDAVTSTGPIPISLVYDTDSPPDHPLGRVVINDMGTGNPAAVARKVGNLTLTADQVPLPFGGRAPFLIGVLTPNPADGRILFVVVGSTDYFREETIKELGDDLRRLVTKIDPSARPFA